jgi:16S rRNA (guanine1207-N2)-methyltransferase
MEHYFSEKPLSKSVNNLILYTYKSKQFNFHTSSSVFSKKRVDKGTDLLIRESIIKNNAKILDIGCGYGVVGIVISNLYPDLTIIMSDINERALELAKKNLALNNVNATIVKSFLFEEINDKFDIILSNPPNSAGKQLCFELIQQSYDHLQFNGSLQLVAHNRKGSKELSKKMQEVFGNIKTIGRQSGYHLFYSEKNN